MQLNIDNLNIKKSKWKIKKKVLETIMYLSENSYPNEFGAMLVSENNLINDIYIIPATTENKHSVLIRSDLVPMSMNIIGTVHSHPSGFGKPSFADLNFFSRKFVNIITYPPFKLNNFKVYNKKGEEIYIEVVV